MTKLFKKKYADSHINDFIIGLKSKQFLKYFVYIALCTPSRLAQMVHFSFLISSTSV